MELAASSAIIPAVNSHVLGHQTEALQVATAVYSGPLDLLLQLIERAELDITRLALAQVTDQYLVYLRDLQEQDAAEVSAFLVIASKLLQIKSEALLPRPPERQPGEEDPAEALARQLLIYRRFKQVSAWLQRREEDRLHTYLRTAAPPRAEGRLDLTGITLHDLVSAAFTIFNGPADGRFGPNTVSVPRITIKDRITSILSTLRQKGNSSLRHLLGQNRSRVEAVVTFLAILELVKRRVILAEQDSLFSDILIQPIEDLDQAEDVEPEIDE